MTYPGNFYWDLFEEKNGLVRSRSELKKWPKLELELGELEWLQILKSVAKWWFQSLFSCTLCLRTIQFDDNLMNQDCSIVYIKCHLRNISNNCFISQILFAPWHMFFHYLLPNWTKEKPRKDSSLDLSMQLPQGRLRTLAPQGALKWDCEKEKKKQQPVLFGTPKICKRWKDFA